MTEPTSGNLYNFSTVCIISFTFYRAILRRRLLLYEIYNDLFISFVIYCFYSAVDIYEKSSENQVLSLNCWFRDSDVFVVLFHVDVLDAELREFKHTFAIIGSESIIRLVVTPNFVILSLLMATRDLNRMMRHFFRKNSKLVRDDLKGFAQHGVEGLFLSDFHAVCGFE